MARARADDVWRERVDDERRETAMAAALEALVPAGGAGPPAWHDVIRRAAALPVCTCRTAGALAYVDCLLERDVPAPGASPVLAASLGCIATQPPRHSLTRQETAWPLPIRSRRIT